MRHDRIKQLGWALVTFGAIAVTLCLLPDNDHSAIPGQDTNKMIFSKEEFAANKTTNAITLAGALVIFAGVRTLLRADKKH